MMLGRCVVINRTAKTYQTTFLHKFMDPKRNVSAEPTEAYNMYDVKFGGIKFNVWDVSGKKSTRSLWPRYYQEGSVDAVIWVVDACSTEERFEESRKELEAQLRQPVLDKKPIYVLVNKMDKEGAVDPEEVARKLKLAQHQDRRKIFVKGVSSKTGQNVKEAMAELAKELKVDLKG
eukprot:TRINITY_DN43_c0_g1_i2.p1 TRINITY_DN43_c0_g1~~TRINITY_DN43_c0_g1_i2.p1  ORF type:complete len:176 (-),score=40.15 TRINITY_DN43_c0_g1_i2:103-630(-)